MIRWWFYNFQRRRLEWLIAIYTFMFGAMLMIPGASFISQTWRGTLEMMPEHSWAILYLATGIMHNIALHVDGRAAWTPFARLIVLFINSQVFLSIALTIAQYHIMAANVFIHSFMGIAFCGVAIAAAAEDCGREIKIAQERRNGGG